ncbi:glycosyltransferase [Nocardioides sp. WS12]|uniref:glycosyltransferase n=1 Tax=Nocardioides sp. WS12 TaxID=2486272 RepID=UPI0015FE71EC|nr:glycosyltransferase [Nocardioides sp. WS12]
MNPLRVRLDPRTRVLEDGRLLIGGTPLTVQRLRRPVAETTSDTKLGHRWLATGLGVPVLDDTPPVPPDQLTVVVPAHGRASRVSACVAALTGLKVIVVDDASDPPIDGATVRLAVNGGPGAARNAGLARVSTPYVAFVDSDVDVSADALLALTRHLHGSDVAVVAPRVRGTGGPRWWQQYDAAFSPSTSDPTPPQSAPAHRCPTYPAPASWPARLVCARWAHSTPNYDSEKTST